MNAEKATFLVPLYGGVALLVLAATGAALSLTDSEGRATGGGARQGGCTYVEACCASSRRNKKTPEGRLQALPKEIEARDREGLAALFSLRSLRPRNGSMRHGWWMSVSASPAHRAWMSL